MSRCGATIAGFTNPARQSAIEAAASAEAARRWAESVEVAAGSILRPEQFGALADGVANDHAAFVATFVAANALNVRHVALSPKTYKLNDVLVIPGNIILALNGATLDFSGVNVAALRNYILGAGTAAAPVTLTEDCGPGSTAGKRLLKVSSAAGIVAGDMLRVWSTTVFDPARTGSLVGEIVFVRSVSGNDIVPTTDLQDLYTTAATARSPALSPSPAGCAACCPRRASCRCLR
jgi:hypothetical protein